MNKLIPVILGLTMLSSTAVLADETPAKGQKEPAAIKKVVKAKKEKAARKAAKAATESKTPAEPKK